MSRRRGSIRTTRNRLRCRASQSSSAGPRRPTPTRRAGCFWSTLRSGAHEWLERADITKGPIFRAIDRWEAVEENALTPQSINLIVKRRCAMAGLEPEAFSVHGRSDRRGSPIAKAASRDC
jgi:hypothetical protein